MLKSVFVVACVQKPAPPIYSRNSCIGMRKRKIMIARKIIIYLIVLNAVRVLLSAHPIFPWYSIIALPKGR